MIDSVLGFLAGAMQRHFEGVLGRGEQPYVSLAALARADGTIAPETEQQVLLSLVGIEREPMGSAAATVMLRPLGEGFASSPPPLALNLLVLLSSQHNIYAESLKRLSVALGFVQAHPAFDPRSTSGFPPELSRISVELVNLDFHALNNLWSLTGAKYLPSVLLKVRLPGIDIGRMHARVAPVRAVVPELHPGSSWRAP